MPLKKYIVGIDPGKKGAIAFININSLKAQVYNMPSYIEELIKLFFPYKENILLVAIEKQQPFPKQGVKSIFNLGTHYGIILGMLTTLQIPYEEISCHKWQKEMIGSNKERGKTKELSLKKAKALFPYLDIGKNHNKADALLIAEYTRRLFVKNG